MKKSVKAALIAAVCLIAAGLVIGLIGFFAGGRWLFADEKTAERELIVSEKFEDILIECERSAVTLLPSEDGACRIVATESERYKLTAEVKSGVLEIRQKGASRWNFGFFDFNFNAFKPYPLTVYLPAGEYGELSVDNVSGGIETAKELIFKNVRVETVSGGIRLNSPVRGDASLESVSGGITAGGFECERIKASCTSGGIRLSDISCGSASVEAISGGVTLSRVIASGELNVNATSGGISFDNCDGGSIRAQTVSGSIKGSLLSPKVFITETVSGKISVPESGAGGECRLETVSGRIEILIAD